MTIGVRERTYLVAIHVLQILAPTIVSFAGFPRYGPFNAFLVWVVLQSAVLFYGIDLIQGDQITAYITNLAIHVALVFAVGIGMELAGIRSLHFQDASYSGGPLRTYATFESSYAVIAMPMGLLWILVRWIEQFVRWKVWSIRNKDGIDPEP